MSCCSTRSAGRAGWRLEDRGDRPALRLTLSRRLLQAPELTAVELVRRNSVHEVAGEFSRRRALRMRERQLAPEAAQVTQATITVDRVAAEVYGLQQPGCLGPARVHVRKAVVVEEERLQPGPVPAQRIGSLGDSIRGSCRGLPGPGTVSGATHPQETKQNSET